jgi:hypothetical protein
MDSSMRHFTNYTSYWKGMQFVFEAEESHVPDHALTVCTSCASPSDVKLTFTTLGGHDAGSFVRVADTPLVEVRNELAARLGTAPHKLKMVLEDGRLVDSMESAVCLCVGQLISSEDQALLDKSMLKRIVYRAERQAFQDFDEAMRRMKASKESVELSPPAKRGVNPVDLVYDIVADLSRRADGDYGWVDIAQVVSMAGHKTVDKEMVSEAIDNWESINVLCRNREKTKVKFMVPSA